MSRVTYLISNLILIFICTALAIGCKVEEISIEGEWRLIHKGENQPLKPFIKHCPVSYPAYFPCDEIIYISSNKIENPLGFDKKHESIESNFIDYSISKNQLILKKDSMQYGYNIHFYKNKFCLENQELCFEHRTSCNSKIDSTIFRFSVSQEFEPSYELRINNKYGEHKNNCSISYLENKMEDETFDLLLNDDEIDYIVRLLERIPKEQLNRIYNNGLSDCRIISIDFYNAEERWCGIETCDINGENPFEIRALISNVFWIMRKYTLKK